MNILTIVWHFFIFPPHDTLGHFDTVPSSRSNEGKGKREEPAQEVASWCICLSVCTNVDQSYECSLSMKRKRERERGGAWSLWRFFSLTQRKCSKTCIYWKRERWKEEKEGRKDGRKKKNGRESRRVGIWEENDRGGRRIRVDRRERVGEGGRK